MRAPRRVWKNVGLGCFLGCYAVGIPQFLGGCSAGGDEPQEKPTSSREPVSEPATCFTDDGCGEGQVCDDGVCTEFTFETSCEPACKEGFYCSSSSECLLEGTCSTADDCEEGLECQNNVCTVGGECGEREFEISALPPNALLLVDRSGSMSASVEGGTSRWDVAVSAINTLLDEFGEIVNFGYAPFSKCEPPGESCVAAEIEVPIGAPIENVRNAVAATELCNKGGPQTIIAGSLNAMVGEASLQQPGRDNAVILITDGKESCGGHADVEALRLRAQDVPVDTYVIGFSEDVNPEDLEAIADAGGTAPYAQANDAVELVESLRQITGNVATCSYELEGDAPTHGLWVFFNKDPDPLPSNNADGWYLDTEANAIRFQGEACRKLKDGEVTELDVIFACEQPIPK